MKAFRPAYSSYCGWLYCVVPGSLAGRIKVYRPDGLGWSFDCHLGGGPNAVRTYINNRIKARETNVPQMELIA